MYSVSVPEVALGFIQWHLQNRCNNATYKEVCKQCVIYTRNETTPLQNHKAYTCYTFYIHSARTKQFEWGRLFPTKCSDSIWWPKASKLNLVHHIHGNETWTILHRRVPENWIVGSHKFPIITSSKQLLEEYLFLKLRAKQLWERAIDICKLKL